MQSAGVKPQNRSMSNCNTGVLGDNNYVGTNSFKNDHMKTKLVNKQTTTIRCQFFSPVNNNNRLFFNFCCQIAQKTPKIVFVIMTLWETSLEKYNIILTRQSASLTSCKICIQRHLGILYYKQVKSRSN